MKTLRLAVLATLIGVGVLCVVSGQAQVAPPGDKAVVPQWEYESVNGENVGMFNALGAEGWELCATSSATPTRAASFIFKRPKRSNPPAGGAKAGAKVEGTWEHTFPDAPENRQVKVINRTHYVWVLYNRQDGKPIGLGGGTYTIDEKSYKEMVAFSSIPELVGKEQTFTAKFEDDKWELTGTLSSGVEINEVWRRIK